LTSDIRAVLWDMDGTLIDDWTAWRHTVAK
jgi:beta-phosphoglucomutase-like phosphatase (HAD superfamily)